MNMWKAVTLYLPVVVLGTSPARADAPLVVYVDGGAGGARNGSSWGDAFVDLQDALDAASNGAEIRVAAGVYRPAGPGAERSATFTLKSGVTVLGGFAGSGHADPDARDIVGFETILSGDLNGDDAAARDEPSSDCCSTHGLPGCDEAACETAVCDRLPLCCLEAWGPQCVREAASICCALCSEANNCENAYHVVTASGTEASAVLDGVTVTGGRAGGTAPSTAPSSIGGGVYNAGGAATLVRCTIRGNAGRWGGGMANDVSASPTLINCRFLGNTADWGGAISHWSSAVTMVNCLFSGNEAGVKAGAVFVDLGSVEMVNCTLAGNTAPQAGGLFGLTGVNLALANSILWGNAADGGSDEAAQLSFTSGSVAVDYTCVQGWTGALGGAGNIGDDPDFVDPLGLDGTRGTEDDNLRLMPTSAAIDAGDPAGVLTAGVTDLDGHARVLCGRSDMGAYEFGIGDFDCNRFVELADFASWDDCMTGPNNGPYLSGCEAFDFEFDEDVDLTDFAGYQGLFGIP